ncbi:MAG: hypothetical protein U0Q16_17150 [Bryobacteraceae bacterium]
MGIRSIFRAAVCAVALSWSLDAAEVSEPSTGVTIRVDESGEWAVSTLDPRWTFAGRVDGPASSIAIRTGSDSVGAYREIGFTFGDQGVFEGSIRTYLDRRVVLFGFKTYEDVPNRTRFPVFSDYPNLPNRLSYVGIFATTVFSYLEPESPWLWFDGSANAFLLSPASRFLVSATTLDSDKIALSPNSRISTLPAGFDYSAILVIENGINKAYETWGKALTDLGGKARPGNDADTTLLNLGYWTDNGAAYYYRLDERLGYTGTLFAIRNEFAAKGVPLGYLQLDSWFYPKGPTQDWVRVDRGIYRYVADPKLFPRTLAGFRDDLGLPLVTHSRWIDRESPYRSEYRVSGDVLVDQRYWDRIATYLSESGVSTFEQDWLGTNAKTDMNLSDPRSFLDNMATAMASKGITMQYCMATPLQFLQSTRYPNLTTIRTSEDRFSRKRWDNFLYASRLASALGAWPWADVFPSAEEDNLLLATLSAGPVGVGDALGSVNAENLRKAVRSDGLIVKPDEPLIPLDSSYVDDVRRLGRPMVASTYTAYGAHRTRYVFTYRRDGDPSFTLTPATLGLSGQVYVFDWFTRQGEPVDAAQPWAREIKGDRDYFVLAPVGGSGIAFLGDIDHFVTVGRKRIADVRDDGTGVEAEVLFAAGEASRVMYGWSAREVQALAVTGTLEWLGKDSATGRFAVRVSPGEGGSARLRIQ